MAYNVTIVYTNAMKTQFPAQRFDLDLDAVPNTPEAANRLQKFTYKDVRGDDVLIYLTPAQVSGIVLAPR